MLAGSSSLPLLDPTFNSSPTAPQSSPLHLLTRSTGAVGSGHLAALQSLHNPKREAPVTLGSLRQRKLDPGHRQVTHYQKRFEDAYVEVSKQRNLSKLAVLFMEVDADGSGEMSLDEFQEAMKIPAIQHAFSTLGIQPHQAAVVYRAFDEDGSGGVTIDEFIGSLKKILGTGSLKDAVKDLNVQELQARATQKKVNDRKEKEKEKKKEMAQVAALLPRSPNQAGPSTAGLPRRMTLEHQGALMHEMMQPVVSSCLAPVRPLSMGTAQDVSTMMQLNIPSGGKRLPDVSVHRAFIHGAMASALHPATVGLNQDKIAKRFSSKGLTSN